MTDKRNADRDAPPGAPESAPGEAASQAAGRTADAPTSPPPTTGDEAAPAATPLSSAADRRHLLRYPARAEAIVTRESDAMRLGLEARLLDISPRGVGLMLPGEVPEPGESVSVRLQNDVQRIQKLTRGIVRHITADESGGTRVGLELYSPLTPLEVSLFRMGIARGDGEAAVWV